MTDRSRSVRIERPETAGAALALSLETGARFAAGGTALQLEWAKGTRRPDVLVDLSAVEALAGIVVSAGSIRIGARETLATVAGHQVVKDRVPLLATAVGTVAGPAVRNLATIGGNVAGRTGCLLPALLALDASVNILTEAGQQTLPLTAFLTLPPAPGVLLASIEIPFVSENARWCQRKTGLRAAFTPSVVGVAAVLEFEGDTVCAARLVVGGGIVPPARLPVTEALLSGRKVAAIDWGTIHAALLGEIVAPGDALRTALYRRRVAANALVVGLGGKLPPRATARPAQLRKPETEVRDDTRLDHRTNAARWHVRPDGPAKIAGTFAYLTDRREPEMLVARILRAGVPHARILSIDTSAAEALPGVAAVVTHRDVAGTNGFGIIMPDQPAFCHDKVRYVGDAVAAVAAVDARTAAAALLLIRVDYAPLPVVDDPQAALLQDAAALHDSGNLLSSFDRETGTVEAAFAGAAHCVEAIYSTARQMHGFMETEGGHAFVDADGTLTVCAGGQHGGRDRFQLSRILALPEDRIRVVTSPTGGAFGGKDELTVQPALALLALKTGRPVRLQLDRTESVIAGTKRHPMTIRMRTACDARGRLVAQEVDVLADGGAYASLGPAVLETALEHACGPYVIENLRAHGRLAYTNNGVCGAFRGFGANQMAFAVECQMDRLARACGLDPFEFRRRNLRRPGTPGLLGQTIAPSERLFEMLEAARTDTLLAKPTGLSPDGDEWIGTGMAVNYQGNGLGTLPPDPAGGRLRLAEDGKIEAVYGLDEIGQGLLTAIQSSVSAALGCDRNDIRPVTGDTGLAIESGSTTASRGTYVVWKVADLAAPAFKRQTLAAAATVLGRPVDDLVLSSGGIAERGSNSGVLVLSFAGLASALPKDDLPCVQVGFDFPKADYTDGNARFIFAFGATLARVAVSRVTGQVRVLDLVQHTAAGPVLDAASYLGQIEGGGLQGLGFTLTENAAMAGGFHVGNNLDSYMLPGIADAPETMAVHALEGLDDGDTFGPRGVGELGIGVVTPAIANAVADAIGYWPHAIPVSPEALLEAMEEHT